MCAKLVSLVRLQTNSLCGGHHRDRQKGSCSLDVIELLHTLILTEILQQHNLFLSLTNNFTSYSHPQVAAICVRNWPNFRLARAHLFKCPVCADDWYEGGILC